MSSASLVWITPNAEQVIIDCARVSSPKPAGSDGAGLLGYLIRNRHWSPFEMASMCLDIVTARDVSRQIIRHRSFSFQEFSQRYAEVSNLSYRREARAQDQSNRQASHPVGDGDVQSWWQDAQDAVANSADETYRKAIRLGIAREVARAVLPEGMTPTRMFMAGTIRSWLHFVEVRDADGVQPECREVAQRAREILGVNLPTIMQDTAHD